MEDFYENNLLPKMFAFPHQYVARMIANTNRNATTGQVNGAASCTSNTNRSSAHKENIRLADSPKSLKASTQKEARKTSPKKASTSKAKL